MTNRSYSHESRFFPLDETVAIPRRLSEYRRGDRVLFVAVTKASYVNVCSIGAEFLRLFEDGTTIRNALRLQIQKHGNEKHITAILEDLLVQIETRGFYQNATVSEDSLTSPTMLARLTNRCNLRCTHCLVSSAPDWPIHNDLTRDQWYGALNGYSSFARINKFSNPRVTFTGGEALTRTDAIDIVAYGKSLNLRTELFTNAVLIVNRRMADRIKEVTDEVQVSFDGATAQIHDSIRGDGMFERALRGARFLAEAGISFRIAVTVMPQNYDDLMLNLPTLIRSLGGGFGVRLSLGMQEGRATNNMVFPPGNTGEEKLKSLVEHLSDEGVRAPRPTRRNLKLISCGYAREITVNSDGLVYGCGPLVHPIGNVKTEAFDSIAARTMNWSVGAEIDRVDGCKECDIRYVCGGICRIRNFTQMGTTTVSSCDRANKEKNIMNLFGRSSGFVPITMLLTSGERRVTL